MRFLFTILTLFIINNLQAQELSDLDWLSGYWSAEEDGVTMEEIWSTSEGGILIGMHKDVFSPDRSFFEFLRIEKVDDKITFLASPRGSTPTPFYLAELKGEKIVFENLDHDYPQRIIYERVDEQLHVQIEDQHKENIISWVWHKTNY